MTDILDRTSGAAKARRRGHYQRQATEAARTVPDLTVDNIGDLPVHDRQASMSALLLWLTINVGGPVAETIGAAVNVHGAPADLVDDVDRIVQAIDDLHDRWNALLPIPAHETEDGGPF